MTVVYFQTIRWLLKMVARKITLKQEMRTFQLRMAMPFLHCFLLASPTILDLGYMGFLPLVTVWILTQDPELSSRPSYIFELAIPIFGDKCIVYLVDSTLWTRFIVLLVCCNDIWHIANITEGINYKLEVLSRQIFFVITQKIRIDTKNCDSPFLKGNFYLCLCT